MARFLLVLVIRRVVRVHVLPLPVRVAARRLLRIPAIQNRADHIRAIHRHARGKLLDYAVVNTREIRPALRRRYARQESAPVEADFDQIGAMGVNVVCGDFVQESGLVRHNPDAIAAIAIELAAEGRRRRQMSR